MAIQFQIELKPDYVVLTCQGAYSKDDILNLFQEAIEIGTREGRRAALVDARELTGEPDKLERYDIGVRVAMFQSENPVLIILAVVGYEPLVDPNRFAEIVAVNRGLSGKVFTEFNDAVDWLEHKLE